MRHAPAETLIAWSWLKPPHTRAPIETDDMPAASSHPDQPDTQGRWVAATRGFAQIAQHVGLLDTIDPGIMLVLDALAASTTLSQFAGTAVLLPASNARKSENQLARLRAGVVFEGTDDFSHIELQIRHLIANHTDTDHASITKRLSKGQIVYSLKDDRLPAGTTICWGPVASYYVIAIGTSAFDTIADRVRGLQPGIPASNWEPIDQAGEGRWNQRHLLIADLDAIHARSRGFEQYLHKMARLQDGSGINRLLLALSWDQPSLEMSGLVENRQGVRRLRIAGLQSAPHLPPPSPEMVAAKELIPDEASSFAIVNLKPPLMVRIAAAAGQLLKHPDDRIPTDAYWQAILNRADVDPWTDIYPYLGNVIMLHDIPRHALDLPFAMTLVIPIQSNSALLRENLRRLLQVLRNEWQEGGSIIRLSETTDGIWYVHFGVHGPGLTVTDQAVIVSFSPQAVRIARDAMSP